jgi:transcriptional regulator with XRE-family HTH domain
MSKQGFPTEKTAHFTVDDLFGLGRRIADQRRAHGWKQREVSRRTGLHATRLSRIERGAVWPGVGELVALSRVFHLSLDELVLGSEAIPQEKREEERLVVSILEAAPPEDREAFLRYLRATLTGCRIARNGASERSLPPGAPPVGILETVRGGLGLP